MQQIDNSISIENLKKIYTSTIGKISSIKQKKYNLTKKYMIKTSEIYLNENETDINSKLEAEEKELKEKLYELNIDKKNQLEQLENISKICKLEISSFYEQLNIYADMNKYFSELQKCEETINKFNETLKKREIFIFVGNEERDLFEATKERDALKETISQVIPTFETNQKEIIEKYQNETKESLKQKQKEIKDFMDLDIKLNNVLNEKTDEELAILDAVKLTRRKRIVQEINKNIRQESTVLTEERRRQMEEAEKEFEAQQQTLTVLTEERRRQMEEAEKEFEVQQQNPTVLTEERRRQMEETEKEFEAQQQNSTVLTEERRRQMEEAEKEFETQQSSVILTEERRRQMEEAEKEFEAHQRETIITSEEKKLSKQEKLKQLKETMKQLNNLETTEKLVIPKSNSTAKLIRTSTKPEEKKYNIQTNNQNPMIEKEIPIEAKISRQVPEQKTKTICERIKERIHNYLYSKKEYSTKTR